MSQKQINHIISYTNNLTKAIDMNIKFDIEKTDGNNSYTLNHDNNNNYGKIYNIAVDIVNCRNSYYLKNICLDK
jgi:hypothetical protein